MKAESARKVTERHTYVVTSSFEFGAGKTQDQWSALIRPFRVLVVEGRPFEWISHLFLKSDSFYVLGALCLTMNKRLLFYPGLIARTPQWYVIRSKLSKMEEGCFIDHLTLEANLGSLHVTMLDLNSRKSGSIRKFKTKRPAEGLTYFFGFSLRSERDLELSPQEIQFLFSSSKPDCERRARIITDNARASLSQVLKLPFTVTKSPDRFLHFDFLVDVQNRNSLKSIVPAPTAAPTGPPALKEIVSTPQSIETQMYPVKLPLLERTLWIVASVRNGELSEKAVFSFPL